MNTQPDLRPGAVIDGDTVVGQLPDGDWLLVAPASTFKQLEGGCYGERIGADGTGRENTDKLLTAGSAAAAYCRTALNKGYDLPSREELDLLYQHRAALDLGEATWAWSSTERSSCTSWTQRFSDGNQYASTRLYDFWVVPVRRIPPVHFSRDKAASLREQRDELLAALEAITDLYDTDEGCRSLPEYKAARAAITKAKGG